MARLRDRCSGAGSDRVRPTNSRGSRSSRRSEEFEPDDEFDQLDDMVPDMMDDLPYMEDWPHTLWANRCRCC
jgi:hypothetical protein